MNIVIKEDYTNWHPLDDWEEGGIAILDDNAFGIEAYIGKEQVGYCTLVDKNSSFYIYDLIIKPEYRKKGIGTNLLKFCINFSKERNGKNINIKAKDEEEKLINFYKRFFPDYNDTFQCLYLE